MPQKECPETHSSYVSQLVFGWIDPMLVLGYKEPLTREKLWDLTPSNTSHDIVAQFDSWDITKKKETQPKSVYMPSFLFALIKCFWGDFLIAIVQKTISDLLTICVQDTPVQTHNYELNSVLFSALKMTSKERQGSTVGEIVNLMAIDTQRFVDLMPYVIMLYSGPLQIALSLYFLSEVIGISVVGGVAVMVLLVPVNAFIATISRKLQFKDMKFKDERTKLMNEILNGIKVLKLYAWEVPFGEMVQGIRNKEVNVLKTLAYYMAGITFVWTCAPFMVCFLCSMILQWGIGGTNPMVALLPHCAVHNCFPIDLLFEFKTDESITIENGDFSWGGAEDGKTLADINLSVPHGQLVAVVGQVGAGKSSLISAILGEMNKQNGKINIQGSIAYVPQQAWIQNATIKDNILMYKPNKPKFYDQILEACALKSDLEILPGGDQIEIGEKGINLSGGQKQRVSLARAVYHNSNIYLLDDPLSAVDSHVGKHIFDEVIGPTGILKDKTRIFVTNGISYLPQCDTVLVLKDGLISETGSYEELLSKKGAFSDFLVNYLTQDQSNIDERDLEHIDEILAQVPGGEIIQRNFNQRQFQMLGLGTMLGAFGMAYGSMRASSILHKLMLDSVLKSPMSFFDTTPIGRIVNRFSKDINVMDVSIVMNFRGWVSTFMQVVSIIIVDVIETPLILVILLPASILYYFVQKVYIASSRQLKRLESVTRSPIYNHFSESVTGASSIRAYGVQDIFVKEAFKRVDTNMICYYPSVVANRWLAVRLEFVGNLIVFFAALFAVMARDSLDSGSVGLSVSYAMSITSSLNWMVRMSSELETNIVSVERILEYSSLETEAEWDSDYNRENTSWPQEGKISFQNYETRYREDLDLVLKGISCNIESGEKIGICGRTGAGKSSLTLALFRIIEATGGSIFIDDVEISRLGLHNLRSRLTIIPQDPVLFSGLLRENLDPFKTHTDAEIWSALEHAHLKTYVSSLASGLEHEVSEGGENLSVGQRQLICLARALLRKTKILVLDEATAAIDLETDDLIQETIRKEFKDCTILTIAHRLNTIMDSTRIIVLDKGVISEFDTPENLLQDKKTIFFGMAKDAGLV
ncbi:ABC transporter C family member 3 [Nymphon striatum]|nr:ABC transporter C family member 3 [Nymphon striatum]